MKIFVFAVSLLLVSSAFGLEAVCGKYSATLKTSGQHIVILTQASDYAPSEGYTFQETSISGAIRKSCHDFFSENDQRVCGLAIENVTLISNTDCW